MPFLRLTIALAIGVFCLPLVSMAQDLTGIWRGYFHTADGDEYRFEIQIEQKKNSISGVSYSYLDTRFYGKATVTGNYNKSTQTALVQEIKTTEVKMSGSSFACIMKCNFTYSKSGKEEFLDGTFTSAFEHSYPERKIEKGDPCGPGTVMLRKVITSDFYIEPFLRNKIEPKKDTVTTKKPVAKAPPATPKTTPKTATKTVPKTTTKTTTTNKPNTSKPTNNTSTAKKTNTNPSTSKSVSKPVNSVGTPKNDSIKKSQPVVVEKTPAKPKFTPPAVTRSRDNELVKTFIVSDDEVTVKFYDNGEIDDDTISVYLDGKPLVMNQRLSTAPVTVKVKMDENNSEHTLVMVAENMGRIPPNTSLMIVHDGDNRYQASITSTEQKNAMVKFRYEKK